MCFLPMKNLSMVVIKKKKIKKKTASSSGYSFIASKFFKTLIWQT